MKKLRVWLVVFIVPFLLPGCKKSYPEGSAVESIKQICENEYKVDVTVKRAGRTIGALIVQPEAILRDLELSKKAFDKVGDVMLTVARVTLSSAFQYDFFVVSILDPQSGVKVSFIRYIKDIRRFIYNDISIYDYFQRSLIKTEVVLPTPAGTQLDYNLKEISVKEFLTMQIADRIESQIRMELLLSQYTLIKQLFKITAVTTEYEPKTEVMDRYPDAGILNVKIHFLPQAPDFSSIGTKALRDNFNEIIFNIVQKVYHHYEFKDCEGLRITDGQGRLLASYDQEEINKSSTNVLMELINSIKKK